MPMHTCTYVYVSVSMCIFPYLCLICAPIFVYLHAHAFVPNTTWIYIAYIYTCIFICTVLRIWGWALFRCVLITWVPRHDKYTVGSFLAFVYGCSDNTVLHSLHYVCLLHMLCYQEIQPYWLFIDQFKYYIVFVLWNHMVCVHLQNQKL